MPLLPHLIPAFVRRRFRRRPEPDSYEATLAATDARIRQLVARITIDLPRSERQARTAATRAVLLVWTVVATAVYLAARSTTARPRHAGAVELHLLPPWSGSRGHHGPVHFAWRWTGATAAIHPRFVAASLVALGPILFCTARLLVSSALDVQRRRTVDALAVQRAALRATLEELKDMTAFYRASALLDRYAYLFPDTDAKQPKKTHFSAPASPSRTRRPSATNPLAPEVPDPTGPTTATTTAAGPARGRAHSTPARAWVQQLVDRVVMGGNADPALDPTRHYALVCQSCFRHNGLVTLATRVRAGFMCRHCGKVMEAPRTGALMIAAAAAGKGVEKLEEKGRGKRNNGMEERKDAMEETRAVSPMRGGGRARAKSAAR